MYYAVYQPYIFSWLYVNCETKESMYKYPGSGKVCYWVIGDSKFLSQAELKREGLTDKHINQWLGKPDTLKPNPVYAYGNFMKLYSEDRVNQCVPF